MNSIFSRKSISFRFFSTSALVLVVGTVVLICAIAVNEGFTQYGILVKKGKGLADYVAKISQDPLVMKDTVQLDSIVNGARYDDDILYTVIYDRSGAAVTSRFASLNYSSPRIEEHRSSLRTVDELEKALEYLRENEATKEVSVPVITGEQVIGKVVVGLSKHNIIDNIVKTILFVTIFNIVIAFILGAILFTISRRIIFTPLTELTTASRSLARGDLSTRVEASAEGEISLLIGSFNQMAEDLQRTTVSREYVDNIIRSMTEALLILSPDYRVMDVNRAACRLLGYTEEELIGMRADALIDTTILAGVTNGTLSASGLCIDTVCQRRDGTSLPILFTASAMHDSNDRYRGIVCNALDISEMKQIYHQLEKTNEALKLEIEQRKDAQEEARMLNLDLEEQKEALEFANRELESFCYSVSHDLRAPLRHINGFTNMLREDYYDTMHEYGRDCLDRICAASKHMGMLIDDLLRFSRVSRTELKFVEVNLSAVAEKIADTYRQAEPTRRISFDIAPGMTTRGDATLLEMVVQNLIDNAWKYSSTVPDARISVGCMEQEGRKVFFVRDNGVGFNMAYKEKLFRVFERLHGEEFEGTGIGLATVHRIVERHGGRVWADATVGHGATFYFIL